MKSIGKSGQDYISTLYSLR